MKRIQVSIIAASFSLLAACGPQSAEVDAKAAGGIPGKPENPGGNGNGNKGSEGPQTRYDLANGCFVLKPSGAELYAETSGDGYAASAGVATAERFYMKPTALGSYMFHATDHRLLSSGDAANQALGGAAATTLEPAADADWTIDTVESGVYTIQNIASGQFLNVDGNGQLVVAADAAAFEFEPADACTPFPEMPVNIGETYVGPARGPLVGFADIHAHMAMGSEVSDGSGNRGPSAAGVQYGQPLNRYGVSKALEDCAVMHGQDGLTSPEWAVLDGAEGEPNHDTTGWPTFVDWPARDSLLHQQMYWKWVERSWRAGQRLMVIHGTNIEALCDVGKKGSGDKNADCTDMGIGLKQVAYVHEMQDYIDAQYGGPGKGWFRVVGDPAEAEAVIRDGKMAVVPGLEFSNIFKCNVTYIDRATGQEVVGCDKTMIDEQIEKVWDAGVRAIYLYHDIDSALGGAGLFQGIAMNLLNFHGTAGFFDTYTCNDVWGDDYFYGAGGNMEGMGEGEFNHPQNPLAQILAEEANGRYPVYPAGRQCNARGTTELGRYALEASMKKGFILDIDHAEISIKEDMLRVASETVPAYPMTSSHGGHGGITSNQALKILQNGGVIYPGMVNGREYTSFVNKVETIWNRLSETQKIEYPLAVGYGADQNGFANQPGPRGGGTPVNYTDGFTLFEGPGWSKNFAAAGIAPVKVEQLKIEGGRSWNVDEDGVANYGMVPDVIGQISLESGGDTKYLDAFYGSAGAYVRLWRQTWAASARRPAPVDPVNPPPMVPHPLDPTTGRLTEAPESLQEDVMTVVDRLPSP